jgi:UDP-glucose 4-epimerase
MQRAVVIGGCGFIGSYVVRELSKKGYEIMVLDNLSTGRRENIADTIAFNEADIRNYDDIAKHIQEGDIVFHLAALTSVPASIENPLPYHETNIRGTYSVFEAARAKKAKGIIFSSSAAVYGNQEGVMDELKVTHPENPYAFHKVFGEHLGQQYTSLYELPFVALRYFNVYGKGNHEEGSYAPVTARFLKAKHEGRPLPVVGDGTQTRDFIHVEDVARANVEAIQLLEKKRSEIINICSGAPMKIIDVAHMVGGDIEHLPPRQEIKHSCGNASKAKELLNFESSISLESGIRELF